VADGLRQLTFAQLDAAVSAAAAMLHREVGTGAVIAVASTLSVDFAVAYYAVLRSGNVVAPINPLLREAELAYQLGLAGVRAAFADRTLGQRLAAVRRELADFDLVLGFDALRELAADPREPAPPRAPVDPDAMASVLFTSGTTGAAKAVALSHRNLTANAVQVALAHRVSANSTCLNHLPTYQSMHLNSAIAAGATQVLCTDPDVTRSFVLAGGYRATHYYSVPARLARLAVDRSLAGLRFGTVTAVGSGGSALSPVASAVLAARLDVAVFQGYGLAETSPLVTSATPDDPAPGTVGRPVAGTECRIVDQDTGVVVGALEAGEVQVRGPQVMRGYLDGGPARSTVDGWFSTGDIGRLDRAGRLILLDRRGDLFKQDNWPVSPAAIERRLARHAAVRDCAVVELPDEISGGVPYALLVLREGVGPEAVRAILDWANTRAPYYEHVADAVVLDAIPRSANGKLQRRYLRELLATCVFEGYQCQQIAESTSLSPVLVRSV
jgi:long-chain acyl-CoA synthetase